jgi:hypothetical protein
LQRTIFGVPVIYRCGELVEISTRSGLRLGFGVGAAVLATLLGW